MAWVEKFPFTNAEFEIGDKQQPWVPNGWTLAESSTRWAYAAFDAYAVGGVENFESGWGIEKAYPTDADAHGWRHKTADRSNMSGFEIDTLANCIVAANAIKVVANLHFGDTDYHVAGDSRTIAAADATNLATLLTLVNELHTDTVAHATDTTPTWHNFKGYGWDYNVVGSSTAADLETAQLRLFDIVLSFSRHLWWRGNRVQWTSFESGLFVDLITSAIDQDASFVGFVDTFDETDTGTAESVEDFEEGWTSEYLDPSVQSQLGSNENSSTELLPTLVTFAHGDEYESLEEGWPEWRHIDADPTSLDNQLLYDEIRCYVVANNLKAVGNAHFPNTSYHVAPDARTIASADATSTATLVTLTNEIYDECKAHIADSGATWHVAVGDGLDGLTSGDYPSTDFASARGVLASILLFFGRHLHWRGCEIHYDSFDYIDFDDIDATSKVYVQNAEFDVANEQYEDFEEEWNSNEDRLPYFTVPTDLTIVNFYEGAADSFDVKRTFLNEPTAPGATSDELDLDPEKEHYFETTGTYVATFRLELQRGVGGSWINALQFTDNSTPLEIPKGYKKARIYCVAWTSGPGVEGLMSWILLDG